jgi:AcrR family transcriptional regulator
LASPSSRPGRKAVASKARLVDAAAAVFRSNGYAGTRLSDIGTVAMMPTTSVYHYVSSREDLVEEVMRVGQERTSGHVRRRVAALPERSTPLEQLREAIVAYLAVILDNGDYAAAFIRVMGQIRMRFGIVGYTSKESTASFGAT